MTRPLGTSGQAWLVMAFASLVVAAQHPALVSAIPHWPPRQRTNHAGFDRVVYLAIEYDESFAGQHGANTRAFIEDAVTQMNLEWRRYRREWFVVREATLRPADGERDASYVLASLLRRTTEAPHTIHMRLVGHPIEVYSNGRSALAVAGVAYRGSDALVVSATPGVGTDLLAYYLFHELGHCWEAADIPFGGGETTFGDQSHATFRVDAGNEQIMEDSVGPLPRTTPKRAPAVIDEKLARAKATVRERNRYDALAELLLYEPSPANPAYMRKRQALLKSAGQDRSAIQSLLARYEITPRHIRQDTELKKRIAAHYWRANEAIVEGTYESAERELDAIRAICGPVPDVHFLVSAVDRKIRRGRPAR
jgi:hypothetical protein